MKKILLALAVLALLAPACPTSLHAQGGQFAINAINVGTPKSPDIPVADIKRFTAGTWIEIEVDFSSTAPITPELTMKYQVVMGSQLLVGEVTHVNVPAGRNLFSVMYVPPRTALAVLKGQMPSGASVQNVVVQIMGGAGPVAQKMLKPSPTIPPSMQPSPMPLLNKAQTPFAPLWWDRYEAIKSK
jgi:hypothetical protein